MADKFDLSNTFDELVIARHLWRPCVPTEEKRCLTAEGAPRTSPRVDANAVPSHLRPFPPATYRLDVLGSRCLIKDS